MLVVVVLGAVQMFVLALMGEYIGRLYNEAKRRPLYIVQEIAGERPRPGGSARSPSDREQRQPGGSGTLPISDALSERPLQRGVERRRRQRVVAVVLAA
jgi:hypothetical protein